MQKDIEFEETLTKLKLDIKGTSRILLIFAVVCLVLKFVFGIAIPLGIFILNLIWFFLYFFVWPRFLKRLRNTQGVQNTYLFFNIVDLLIITGVIHYTGGVSWIAVIFYTPTLTVGGLILPRKKATLFSLIALLLFTCLISLEAWGVLEHRPMFELGPELYRSPPFLITQILVIGAIFYFLADTTSEYYQSMKQKRKQIEKEKQRVVEAYHQAKEAEKVLEIRVRARTGELENLTKRQEEMIAERTKKLQEKIDELERFHKLVVGRELKMVELKKELEKLKAINR